MGNLLENALVYTDSPGCIQIDLGISQKQVFLGISDTALDPSFEQLFEPLFRAEASRNRHSGGAGLGPAVCCNIVEAHGGPISAMPSKSNGLCVTITLAAAISECELHRRALSQRQNYRYPGEKLVQKTAFGTGG
tara:strand:- start:38565 stop:38969 length:405 start_codon:yes stop_codon:yes gene_type:complete